MITRLAAIYRDPSLAARLTLTVVLLALYRLGTLVPAPFVDVASIQQCMTGQSPGGVTDVLNLLSGGAMLKLSLFALGIMPFVSATIIVQLLRTVVPSWKAAYKEGNAGRKKLARYTRRLALGLALFQAVSLVTTAASGTLFGSAAAPGCTQVFTSNDWWILAIVVAALVAGVALVIALSEAITAKGIGNGVSMMILVSVLFSLPASFTAIAIAHGPAALALIAAITAALTAVVITVELVQRRIPLRYAKRTTGSGQHSHADTYLPLKINMAGVMPVIFASSLLYIPAGIARAAVAEGQPPPAWVDWINANLTHASSPLYLLLEFALIVGFSYFYVALSFDPAEVATTMAETGGYIPGVRSGAATESYLKSAVGKVILPGALYLGAIAITPAVLLAVLAPTVSFPFGGTSILIAVVVTMDLVRAIRAQTRQGSYRGILARALPGI